MATGSVKSLATILNAKLKYLFGSAREVLKMPYSLSVVNARNLGVCFVVQMLKKGFMRKYTDLVWLA